MDMERACLLNGCQLRDAELALGRARETLRRVQQMTERTEFVSAALWCDMGEHSFSSKDRGKVTYKIETTDPDSGDPVEETMTACGPCAAKRKAMFAPQPALPPGVDKEEYTRYLEWKNGLVQEAAQP